MAEISLPSPAASGIRRRSSSGSMTWRRTCSCSRPQTGPNQRAVGLEMSKLPKAILFDLDDTILAAFGQAEGQWRRVVAAFIEDLAPHPPDDVVAAIQAYSRHLWSDAARHKDWRPRIGAARRHIVSR